MTIRILTTRALPFPPLTAKGETIEFTPLQDGKTDGAVALVATAVDPVTAEIIATLPDSVGLIANFGVGTDNIDLDVAKARGIAVSNTPVVTEDTADLAFAHIMAAARRIATADRYVRDGQWEKGTSMPLGARVHGAKLAIVGFGAIGQAVARRASGFDMDISYWNRSEYPHAVLLNARRVETLEELVAEADIVSIHLPLTPETRHIFNADLFAHFKDGAILVNTARGSVVDEAALVGALQSGKLGAAGLDVFEDEPRVHPQLLEMEQVVLAPHIGSATTACRADMAGTVIRNLLSFIETGKPVNRVI